MRGEKGALPRWSEEHSLAGALPSVRAKHNTPFHSLQQPCFSSHQRVYFISSEFSGQIIQAFSGRVFYFKEKFVKNYISPSLWLIGFD